MLVQDTQIIQCGTSRYIRQFNEKFVMSDFIKCYTMYLRQEPGSWAKYCTVTLGEMCERVSQPKGVFPGGHLF